MRVRGLATTGAQGPVWVDGDLVAWEDARLHVASFGLHNASCVFEGIRVYDGHPFALREHCERLRSSANALGFELPYAIADLERAVHATVAANGHANAYVRPVAWRGSEIVGVDPAGTSLHLAIIVLPFPAGQPPDGASGVSLWLSKWTRAGPTAMPMNAKASCHYVTSALALQEATTAGCDDALLVDQHGNIAEASGANIFIIRDRVVITPIPDSALDGITRRKVIAICRELGLTVREARLRPADLQQADEAFLTGTACEVQPVRAAIGVALPATNSITREIASAYRRLTVTRAGSGD